MKKLLLYLLRKVYRVNILDNAVFTFKGCKIAPKITGNCQLTVLGDFHKLYDASSTIKDVSRIITRYTSTRLLLLDVRSEYTSAVERLGFPVLLKQGYISTNGSEMTIFILKISQIPDPFTKPIL